MGYEVCLVIGGRGFIGRHLVTKLLEKGGWQILILDFRKEINLDESERNGPLGLALEDGRVGYISADVRDSEQVREACRGVHTVFHMASPQPTNHNPDLHKAVNVTGTRNIIEACMKENVKKLIYTSSASVVFDGIHDLKNGDESLPYPEKPMDSYNETKAQAEKLILEANGEGGLATVAVRPSGVFGPGDPLFLPKVANNAAAGKLKFMIGDGENMMDFTYVENVVHAHLIAEQALGLPRTDPEYDPSGKAFFITNGEPRKFWGFIADMVDLLGYDRPSVKLPAGPLLAVSYVAEAVFKALEPLGVPKSDFSPFVIRNATVWRTFSCARAAKLLGYAPPVPLEEGLRRTVASFPQFRKEAMVKPREKAAVSKAHTLLGGGQAADVLLWRNVKHSALLLSLLLLAFYAVFGSGHTLVSLLANAALAAVVLLFSYHHLQFIIKSRLGYTLPEVSVQFEIPEGPFRVVASHVRELWNNSVLPVGHKLFIKRDVVFFLQVMLSLYLTKWFLGSLHTKTLLCTFLVGAFVIPIIYDKYEDSIDAAAAQAGERLTYVRSEFKQRAMDLQATVSSKLPKSLQRKQD